MTLTIPKTCSMGSSNTGLVETIGVTLLNPDGTTHTARSTASIYEIGGGCYGKQIGFDDEWTGSIKWDTGGGSPVYATEEYIYYENNPKVDTILTDTNELQINQGNWITATGFSIPNEYNTVIAALQTDLDNPAQYKATGFSTHSADDVWLSTTRSLTDKVGFALSTVGIKAIWDQLTSALTTVGSIGKLLVDNINATISSRNSTVPDVAGTAATLHGVTDDKLDVIDGIVDVIKSKTDNLPSGIAKNEALPKFDFLMVLSSDHISGATGKTVTGEIMKDGGAFTAITNTITEVSNGMYTIASGFTQEEMNCDIATLKFTANSCDNRIITLLMN